MSYMELVSEMDAVDKIGKTLIAEDCQGERASIDVCSPDIVVQGERAIEWYFLDDTHTTWRPTLVLELY